MSWSSAAPLIAYSDCCSKYSKNRTSFGIRLNMACDSESSGNPREPPPQAGSERCCEEYPECRQAPSRRETDLVPGSADHGSHRERTQREPEIQRGAVSAHDESACAGRCR